MPALVNVVRYLRRLAGPPPAAEASDGQLLQRFVATQDSAAFSTLMQRHGGLVLGVCGRLLDDANDVDDAFQATFLVLVRKASSISKCDSVASWLYGVAYRTALKARSTAARRRVREREASTMPTMNQPSTADWSDLRPVLDEELSRLPEKYRAPLVLCYLEGKTNDEAADLLGWTKGTVSGRLARLRDLLRKRLTRRGIALSSVALAGLLTEQAGSASVPALLAANTLNAALGVVAMNTIAAGVVSVSVAKLTEGVLHAMFLTKIKIAAVVLITAGIVTAGTGMMIAQGIASDGLGKQAGAAKQAFAADDKDKPIDAKPTKKQTKSDKELLQGLWKFSKLGAGSPEASEEELKKVKMFFHGDSAIVAEGNHFSKGAYKLNPSETPKELDITIDDRTIQFIYRLTGDELTICFVVEGGTRPTEFKGDVDKRQSVATLKRETMPEEVAAFKKAAEEKIKAGPPAGVARSANNLKQIALAMHNYASVYGHLPPQAIYSKDGKPLLSWRVLSLPFIEQDNLYRKFHLNEPWDSEHNKKLSETIVKTYAPVVRGKENVTYYRVFTGMDTIFEGPKMVKFTDIIDGTSNTILAVEAGDPVVWTKPDELAYDPKKPLPKLGGLFDGSFNMVTADGAVRFVKTGFDEKILRAAITRNGGEVFDWSKLEK